MHLNNELHLRRILIRDNAIFIIILKDILDIYNATFKRYAIEIYYVIYG